MTAGTTPTPATRPPAHRTWVRLGIVAIGALGLAAGVTVIAVTSPTPDSIYPKCMLHSATGIHCPGCGTGRAAHFALNGQFLTAAKYNALSLVALPIILISLVRSVLAWAFDWPPRRRPARPVWLWLLAGSLITFGIIRNLPFEPFTRLAPAELESSTVNSNP